MAFTWNDAAQIIDAFSAGTVLQYDALSVPVQPVIAASDGISRNILVSVVSIGNTADSLQLESSTTGDFNGEEVNVYAWTSDLHLAPLDYDSTDLGSDGITVYYRAYAINSAGNSIYSAIVSESSGLETVAPGVPASFAVDGDSEATWILIDSLNDQSSIEIFNGTWIELLNLDSTPLVEIAQLVIPGASGTIPNEDGEYGLRLVVANSTGSSFSAESWVVLNTDNTNVTSGALSGVTTTSLTSVTVGLASSPTNFSTFNIQRSLTGGSGASGWATIDTASDTTIFPYLDTGLAEDTQYFYRLEVSGVSGVVYSSTVGGFTGSGAQPTPLIFFDSFSSGDTSHTDNGVNWGSMNNTTITTDIARTGTYSMKFAFPQGTGNGFAEQRFDLGSEYTDVYLKWYQYFPDGTEGLGPKWVHRVNPTKSDNNKMYRLWGNSPRTASSNAIVGGGASFWSYISSSSGTLKERLKSDTFRNYNGSTSTPPGYAMGPVGDGMVSPLVDSFLGRWIEVQVRQKVESSLDSGDGIIEIWWDGLKVSSEVVDTYPGNGYLNAYTAGYLMGAANSGFDLASNTYIDDFSVTIG